MDDRPEGQSSFDTTSDQPEGTGALAAEHGPGFPWPPRPRESALQALAETLRRSLFQPTQFFRALPPDAPLGPALLYYLVIGVLAAGIGLFWGSLFAVVAPGDGVLAAMLGAGEGDWGWRVVEFLLSPLWLVLVLYVVAAIVHVALVIFGGARRGFGGSLRALAYAVGPQLLVIVPVVGYIAAAVWGLVLSVIGLREVHGTSTGRALAAVLAPLLLLLIPIAFLLFVAVGLLMM